MFFERNRLPLPWWHPAGEPSGRRLDWHCLFCGTDPDPISKERMTKKIILGKKKNHNL